MSFFARNDNISFGWNFVREEWKRSPGWIRQIADLFSFLISFALKKEEQESSLDFVIVMIREGLFSLEQRTKACFMSFRVSLTPATILRRAMLENAKAFSVHETGFKHKIYRWLCFAEMRDLVSETGQERIQDRAFSIRHRK